MSSPAYYSTAVDIAEQEAVLIERAKPTRKIFKKYLRSKPLPKKSKRPMLEDHLVTIRHRAHAGHDKEVSFQDYYTFIRYGFLHRGERPNMSRLSHLLNKVSNTEEFDKTVALLIHCQRQRWEFGERLSNTFVATAIRVNVPEKALALLHRSVLSRNTADEAPFYRMFPGPVSYANLIEVFFQRNDLASALKTFSIATAQNRDNPDGLSGWSKVYLWGMKCYFAKKSFVLVRKIHEEVLFLGLPELPQMRLIRMRIDTIINSATQREALHHNARLLHERVPGTIYAAEASALLAYAENSPELAQAVPARYLLAVLANLKSYLDLDKLKALWPQAAEDIDIQQNHQRQQQARKQLLAEAAALNPFFTALPPNFLPLYLAADDAPTLANLDHKKQRRQQTLASFEIVDQKLAKLQRAREEWAQLHPESDSDE